jgi:hypothetical protein
MSNVQGGARARVTVASLTPVEALLPLIPQQCPRWLECSAAICALDPSAGAHVNGDRLCYYIAEAAKLDARCDKAPPAAFKESPNREILARATTALPGLIASVGAPFRRAVRRAAAKGSRSDRVLKARSALAARSAVRGS